MSYTDFDTERFTVNKYLFVYRRIINRALERKIPKGVYFERHHILPKSLWPQFAKEKWNIVKLLPKEHFVCHLLLTKFTSSNDRGKMSYALWGMTNKRNKCQQGRHIASSKQYAYAKELVRSTLSTERKGKNLEERYGEKQAASIRIKLANRIGRKPMSDEELEYASIRAKTGHQQGKYKYPFKERHTCLYCGNTTNIGNYAKYHGDKCKLRSPSVFPEIDL